MWLFLSQVTVKCLFFCFRWALIRLPFELFYNLSFVFLKMNCLHGVTSFALTTFTHTKQTHPTCACLLDWLIVGWGGGGWEKSLSIMRPLPLTVTVSKTASVNKPRVVKSVKRQRCWHSGWCSIHHEGRQSCAICRSVVAIAVIPELQLLHRGQFDLCRRVVAF